MATFVLVHGGWHGAWCWERVTQILRDAGHAVHAPTLAGLGERAHLLTPQVGLDTHVQDVYDLLANEELSGVILVGHSYGGMVITRGRGPGRRPHSPPRLSRRLRARGRPVVLRPAAP